MPALGRREALTARLALHQFAAADAAGFFALNNDPEVMRYTGDEPFADEAAARAFLLAYDHYARYGYGRWSLYRRETGEYAGFCGLKYTPEKDEVDLGFRLMRRYWGQGLATEAARAALRLGFERYDLTRIVGRAMAANAASQRVLVKVGMVPVGRFQEAGVDWVLLAIDRGVPAG